MATGLANQLTRQIGEHLVAAKLGRMGYVAAPYAGNVPLFDLLAADSKGRAIPVQVKTCNEGSWQFRGDSYLDIETDAKGVQHVRGKLRLVNRDLVYVYVLLRKDERDEFYVMSAADVHALALQKYRTGRKRESKHCAFWPEDLAKYRDNWKLITKTFARLKE